jgi:hypothetical protein
MGAIDVEQQADSRFLQVWAVWFTMLDATKIDGSPAMPEGKRQANTHPQPG